MICAYLIITKLGFKEDYRIIIGKFVTLIAMRLIIGYGD